MGERIFDLLTTDAAVFALVGDRVSPNVMPQDQALPALVYTLIDNAPINTLDGPADLRRAPVQIDCYGVSYDALQTIADAVEDVFGALASPILRRQDFYEDTTQLHRCSMDIAYWSNEDR